MADSRTEFAVRGVESETDEREIDDALGALEGVQMVKIDPEGDRVEVRYGEELISEEEIRSAVRDLGYEVE